MDGQVLHYEGDGLQMKGHLFADDSAQGPRPGILVFPEATGVSDHSMAKARRLAEAGYVALACDLHGEAKFMTDMPAIMAIIGELREAPSRVEARAKAALDALIGTGRVDASKIAAIGFCFGGTMALELARGGNEVAGVVGLHSRLGTERPEGAKNIKGKVLVLNGADDPIVGPDERLAFEAEMREGKVDWQMKLYGGVVHSYTNPEIDKLGADFARYNKSADERSWAEMLAFFDEIF